MKQQDKIIIAIILAGLIISISIFLVFNSILTGRIINEVDKPVLTIIPEPEYATITRVIDGDTLEIDTGERVRLVCIDAPERGEKGYSEAKEFLEDLVLNKEVKLQRDITDKDKYDRLLRYIYTKEGTFVDELMVLEGHAQAYVYEPDTRLCPQIIEAENIAKKKDKGIWPYKTGDPCLDLGCPKGTIYVGSINSDKYHDCDCRHAKNIAEKNLNCFISRDDAKRQDYVGCKKCRG